MVVFRDAFVYHEPIRHSESYNKLLAVVANQEAGWNRVDFKLQPLGIKNTMETGRAPTQVRPAENRHGPNGAILRRKKESRVMVVL